MISKSELLSVLCYLYARFCRLKIVVLGKLFIKLAVPQPLYLKRRFSHRGAMLPVDPINSSLKRI